MRHPWDQHPTGVGHSRTVGERAADAMRLGMGTWTFLAAFGLVMVAWVATGGWFGWDPNPYFRLNLGLSCLAGLQCAILLISAKRQDRIAADLARHHYDTSVRIEKMLRRLLEGQSAVSRPDVAKITAEVGAQLAHHHDRLMDAVAGHAPRPDATRPSPRKAPR